ncbi:MAG: ATP-binding cassette domain-containing protein [Spirochaetaceae bacterium]|jgi:energy-coupling factor transport system ATP-binding protein|nr:ATP-binding cassette domain-containing protein [Spirochaetaceae bacterium]
MTVVSAENVTYIYPETGLKAVDSVSLRLEQGEYLAVLGANGSGKSTLARILSGILEPSEGTVSVGESSGGEGGIPRGTEVPHGMVFQSPRDQIVAGIVRSDTAFGPENLGLDDREIGRRVQENLSLTGLLEKALEKTLTLSAGQKQKLAIAGILALRPGLLILDEATSMIDPPARKELLAFLDRRNGEGQTIIHVTHDMDEAARASRTIVLCEGKKVFDGTPAELLLRQELSAWAIHAEPLFPAEGRGPLVPKAKERGSCALFLDAVSFGYSPETEVFSGLSLGVEKGSLTAVMGSSGSGKSTLFELSAGILSPRTGTVYTFSGNGGNPYTAALAMQESENSLFEEFVSDDVAWGPRNQGVAGPALRERVREAMELTGLPFDRFAERKTYTLSGGEKRRASLAGIIALDADIFLFDEPTSALDPVGRALILKVFRSLRDSGKTVVFSTHRTAEAMAAERVVVFENGKIIADGPPDAVIRDGGWIRDSAGSENPLGSENSTGFQTSSNTCIPSGMVPASVPEGAALLEGFRLSSGGAYRSLNTPVHRLVPVWKYAVMLFLMICGIAFPLFLLPGAIAGAGVYAGLARYSFRKIIVSLVKMLPWILVILLFQMLLFPDRPGDTVFVRLWFVTLTDRKILFTITMLLRFIVLVTVLSVFVFSTEETEVLYGMEDILKPLSLIGVPVQHAALVTGIVFRFVPLLQGEALYILKAQILRGGTFRGKGVFGKLRAMIPVFIPLMVQTLNRAAALGEALDARYYSRGKRRRWNLKDSESP